MGQLVSRTFWPEPTAAWPAQTPTVRTSPTTPVPHAAVAVSAEPAPSPGKHETHEQQGAPATDNPTPTTTTAVSSTTMAVQPTATDSAISAGRPRSPNGINNTAGSKPPHLRLGLVLASSAAVMPCSHAIDTPSNQNMSRKGRPPALTDIPAISAALLDSYYKYRNAPMKHMIGPSNAMVDLEGGTMTADKLPVEHQVIGLTYCVITTGLTVRNGTVMVPAGTSFMILADNVKLQDLTIIKKTADISCLTILNAKNVVVENCIIKFLLPAATARVKKTAPGYSSTHSCVFVHGSRTSFRGCVLTGAPGSGLQVYGNSTHVKVTDTYVLDNGYAGFVALGGAVLHLGSYCAAIGNGNDGILALSEGRINMGNGCRAVGNGGHGFSAVRDKSQLKLGSGCVAERNNVGYYARDEADVNVGAGCVALSNAHLGVCSSLAHMRLGPQCAVVGTVHKDQGFGVLAIQGSTVEVNHGFIATSNRGPAGVAQDQGSKLVMGPGSRIPKGGGQVRTFKKCRDDEVLDRA